MIQFGCTPKRSTHMAIIRFLHNSAMGHIQSSSFGAIAVDFSKAYDKVPHGILLSKLQRDEVPNYLLHYVRNWLTDRQCQVINGNTRSRAYTPQCGIPQGSPLSVWLWKFFVSDVPLEDKTTNFYMDDILFWYQARTSKELQMRLQQAADKLTKWCNHNGMKVNQDKTKFIMNKIPLYNTPVIRIQGKPYTPTSRLKYLGVEFTSSEMTDVIELDLGRVKSDLIRRTSLVGRVKYLLTSADMMTVAKAIVMGKLNYFLPFLGAESPETLRPLEVGLNQCMRIITGAFPSTPIPLLHSWTGIPPIRTLIKKTAANMFYSMKQYPSILTREYML